MYQKNIIVSMIIIFIFCGTGIMQAAQMNSSILNLDENQEWYTPELEWTQNYPGDDYDVLVCLSQHHLGGYDLFYNSRSGEQEQIIMIRTNLLGDMQWKISLLEDIDEYKRVEKIHQTRDGGYILAGESVRTDTYEDVAMLIKLDKDGELDWYTIYDENPGYSYMLSARETLDDGYIAVGAVSRYEDDEHYYGLSLRKTDRNGSDLWHQVYDMAPNHYIGWDVIETKEGYILLTEQSDDSSNRISYLVGTDHEGNQLWQQELLPDSYFEFKPTMIRISDHEFMFLGNQYDLVNRSLRGMLIRFNDNGDIIWKQSVAGTNNNPNTLVSSFIQTPDEGFLFTGSENYQAMLLKTDHLGQIQWRTSYEDCYVGEDLLRAIDGGYVILGQSIQGNEYDIILVKTMNSPQNPIALFSGEQTGKPEKKYSYDLTSMDSDGDDIFYIIDWDDDSEYETIGPCSSGQKVSANHTWTEKGSYEVKVKITDTYDQSSEWTSFQVSMPKHRIINRVIFQIIEYFKLNLPFVFSILESKSY